MDSLHTHACIQFIFLFFIFLQIYIRSMVQDYWSTIIKCVNISMGAMCLNILKLHSVLIILELLLIRECVCMSWDLEYCGGKPSLCVTHHIACIYCVDAEFMPRIGQRSCFCIRFSTDWGAMWEFRPQLCIDDFLGLVFTWFTSTLMLRSLWQVWQWHNNSVPKNFP